MDTLVRIDVTGNISTTLYRKPIAVNSILRADSSHSTALEQSIPFAQYLRLKRICTSMSDSDMQAKALQFRLLQRGYSRPLLKKAYQHALKRDRHELLYKPKPFVNEVEPTSCILTFSQQHQIIRNIIQKYWFLLAEDSILASYVTKKPSITYR